MPVSDKRLATVVPFYAALDTFQITPHGTAWNRLIKSAKSLEKLCFHYVWSGGRDSKSLEGNSMGIRFPPRHQDYSRDRGCLAGTEFPSETPPKSIRRDRAISFPRRCFPSLRPIMLFSWCASDCIGSPKPRKLARSSRCHQSAGRMGVRFPGGETVIQHSVICPPLNARRLKAAPSSLVVRIGCFPAACLPVPGGIDRASIWSAGLDRAGPNA